jgi:uncharacterized protein YbcI
MATPDAPLQGDELLAALAEAMSALHDRYYHRPPGSSQCRLMGDDLLACVLGGVYTEVEKTLIELERAPLVHDSRNAFQSAMEDRFVSLVERLSGRTVTQFVSTHSIGPDLEIELFFLGDLLAAPAGG